MLHGVRIFGGVFSDEYFELFMVYFLGNLLVYIEQAKKYLNYEIFIEEFRIMWYTN